MHYGDVIMGAIASQISSLTIVYSVVYSGADQRKPQSSALLAFVRGIHRWPVISPHKGPVTRKMFPFDHVIMELAIAGYPWNTLESLEYFFFYVNHSWLFLAEFDSKRIREISLNHCGFTDVD